MAADHRSDVFSFGCVLYEMLTGRLAFPGDSVPEVLASILAREPDLTVLPDHLNPRLVELLSRCFDKHPKRRWQATGDLRTELETVALTPFVDIPVAGPARLSAWRRTSALAATAVFAAAIAGSIGFYVRPVPALPRVVRFTVPLEAGQSFTGFGAQMFALSPDGTRLVFVADRRLYLRSLAESEPKLVAGAGGGAGLLGVAFSPDGKAVAFWSATDRTLKRVSIAGGPPHTIASVGEVIAGMSWDASGILFAVANRVMRVSPDGGEPEELIALPDGELVHGPQMLPGGGAVLFTVATGTAADRWDNASIVVQTLASRERRRLVDGTDGRYVASGHIVYAKGRTMFAVPFAPASLEVRGSPVAVVEGVRRELNGEAHFEASDAGVMVYMRVSPDGTTGTDLAITDRHGALTTLALPALVYETPRVSPNGKLIAMGVDEGAGMNIWIQDVAAARSMRRITVGGHNRFPVWSPSGRRLAFQSDRDGDNAIFVQDVDGAGGAARVTTPDRGTSHTPESWSPDDAILFTASGSTGQSRLRVLSLAKGTHAPFGSVESATPISAAFHPTGRWIAYAVLEGPSMKVYIQPFPATGAVHQVSRGDDGHHPVWSHDGSELFFVAGPGHFAVAGITTAPAFTLTGPVDIAPGLNTASTRVERGFDVMPDGRLLGIISREDRQTYAADRRQLQVVLNWFEELRAKVPVN